MKNIVDVISESLNIEEAKHERKEIDHLQFKVSCIMSNFPYSEYDGKEVDAVKLVAESIVNFLVEVFPEYKEKIEVNSKRILLQGLSKMFKQYIPVKVNAQKLWDSGDAFSNEGFKIGEQEQKMLDYMIKSVKNYIEKIYQFANKEAEKDDNKVSESFEESCEKIFEARSNEIAWLLSFEDFKDYFDSIWITSPEIGVKLLLKYSGLSSAIGETDKTKFSSEMDKVIQKRQDWKTFYRSALKNRKDFKKEPLIDQKEYKNKHNAYIDALKDLYKLLCDLTDKYDADYPEEN